MKGVLFLVTAMILMAAVAAPPAELSRRKHQKNPPSAKESPSADPLFVPCHDNATGVDTATTATAPPGQHLHFLPALPAVDTNWYPVPFSYPYATQSPLTRAQLQRGLPPAITPELLRQFSPLLRRLTAVCPQEPV